MSADNTVHVQFGISNAYVAVIDDDGEYATPFPVPGFVKLTIDAAGDSTTKYADNVPVYTSNANAGYTGSLEFTTICDKFYTDVLGYIKDGNGGLLETMEAKPKSFALLYQVEGDANNARYVFYKVDAKRPTGEHNTTTESTEVDDSSMEITMTGKQFTIGTETKTCVKNRVLNDTTGATAYASFFTAVMEPKAAA